MDSSPTSVWDYAFSLPWPVVFKFLETAQLLSKVKFDGRSKIDALGHLYQFIQNSSTLNIFDQGTFCKLFTATFKGQIRKWFDAFATGSIDSWKQFMRFFVFTHQNYDYDQLCEEIESIQREEDESIADFYLRVIQHS